MVFRGKKTEIKIDGESRSDVIGATVTGFPKDFHINTEALARFTERRRAKDEFSTPRREKDEAVFVSGVTNGITNGDPIRIEIRNTDVRHEAPTFVPRPSHADYPAFVKNGAIPEGGGAFSGRMTAPLCAAGGLFVQFLASKGIFIQSHVYSVGSVYDTPFDPLGEKKDTVTDDGFPVIDRTAGKRMQAVIADAMKNGDSVGGVAECAVFGVPAGTGGALFDGLEGAISYAVFAIPGIKGVEFGSGFAGSAKTGSENNDGYYYDNGEVKTYSNHAGGILGGMATGCAPILFRAAVKPVPSIARELKTVDLAAKTDTVIRCAGRNDPCVLPRVLPVLEAAAAIAVADAML